MLTVRGDALAPGPGELRMAVKRRPAWPITNSGPFGATTPGEDLPARAPPLAAASTAGLRGALPAACGVGSGRCTSRPMGPGQQQLRLQRWMRGSISTQADDRYRGVDMQDEVCFGQECGTGWCCWTAAGGQVAQKQKG